jgi:N-acetyltransferase
MGEAVTERIAPDVPLVVRPVVLEGSVVRLEPLEASHLEELCQVALDPRIWAWYVDEPKTRADVERIVQAALTARDAGREMPFITRERASGRLVGSTRYLNLNPRRHAVEIGWTWVLPAWQRTAVNTEAKYLMLRHAFEDLRCIRVELATDSLNQASRNAILRLGAKEEGTWRNAWVTHTGRIRHTVFFSIIDTEWPEAKARLEAFLRRGS